MDHYLYDGKKCIIVTKGDSGSDNFHRQIDMYQNMSSLEWNRSIFTMKHYISLSNQINNMSDEDVISAFSNKVIILDEVHNVRYLKKVVEHSVYGSIIRLLTLCDNVKMIMATATPMTDNKDQINSLLGICNYSRSDKSSMRGIISYNSVIRDKPISRKIKNTLSACRLRAGAEDFYEDYVPGMSVYYSEMTGYQLDVYRRESKDKPPDDIYRELTHISLFCFDDGLHGREVTEANRKMTRTKLIKTITSMSTKKTKEVRYVKYDILPTHAHLLMGDELRKCSSKYSTVIRDLESSTGNAFIFLEEVRGSGLLLLAAVLEQHGYELYVGEELESIRPARRYTMCVGSTEICPNINDRLDGFNSYSNREGEYVRILLGSKVIGESITLKNVRHFHCLTPHWNDSTIDQAIGRVVRNGSHIDLDETDRNVDIYIHASVFLDNPYSSIDVKKLEKCKQKEQSIQDVERDMVDQAVDKYCLVEDTEPIEYFTNFAAAYIQNHMDGITEAVSERFKETEENIIDINNLSSINSIILNEALCRIIHDNVMINGRFLRAWGEHVFLVDDPSTPYVTLPDVSSLQTELSLDNHDPLGSPKFLHTEFVDGASFVQTFRYMPVKQKAALLEDAITNARYNILEHLQTLYININRNLYHLLLYRNLESSYTSSNPVPKRPLGKTRKFALKTSWEYVESREEEQMVFDNYKVQMDSLLNLADSNYSIYGLISTIDGDMRLRLRDTEDKQKSSNDHRYVKRGKNMKSIKKDRLLHILEISCGSISAKLEMSISEIVRLIDTAIVNAGTYVII